MCIDCVNQVKKLAWSGTEVLSPRKVGGARCPAYGVSERYSKDIICTIIQAKWYNYTPSERVELLESVAGFSYCAHRVGARHSTITPSPMFKDLPIFVHEIKIEDKKKSGDKPGFTVPFPVQSDLRTISGRDPYLERQTGKEATADIRDIAICTPCFDVPLFLLQPAFVVRQFDRPLCMLASR